jgi:hypothetical protein
MGRERWLASLCGERERNQNGLGEMASKPAWGKREKKGKSGPGGENWLGKHFVISKSLVLILDLI